MQLEYLRQKLNIIRLKLRTNRIKETEVIVYIENPDGSISPVSSVISRSAGGNQIIILKGDKEDVYF